MSLILTTPPLVEPISLAEAKAHLRITHSDDDAYISTLIIAARRLVEARTGLRLLQQGWSIFLDAWPNDGVIDLPLSPVSAVDDIVTYGELDTPAILDHAHYFLDAASRPARVVFRQGRNPANPGRRAKGIEVKVQAGFGATASAVPQDLKQAALFITAHWFSRRGEGDDGVLPMAVLELLSPYRMMRLT
jgi:uncharacterized phiE125 gp8 family phage protein